MVRPRADRRERRAGADRGARQRADPGDGSRARGGDEATARGVTAAGARRGVMTQLYLLEPEPAGAAWAPFAGVRPVSELRAGAWRIRERWEAALDADAAAILGSHVEGFHDGDEPPVRAVGPVQGPAVVGLSRFAPSGARVVPGAQHRRLVHEGSTVGWIVPAGGRWEGGSDAGPALEIEGMLLHGAYDLVTALERLLPGDCADFRAAPAGPVPEGSLVLGDPADVRCRDALVEPACCSTCGTARLFWSPARKPATVPGSRGRSSSVRGR